MAIQRWTIAKIGGASAAPLVNLFDRWSQKCQQIDLADSEWDEAHLQAMRSFVAALRSHSLELPILFFSEHIDQWSVGCQLFDSLDKVQLNRIRFVTASYTMACLHRPEYAKLLKKSNDARTDRKRSQEERCFFTILGQAFRAYDAFETDSVIIIVRESFGPSRDDKEILSTIAAVPDWIAALQ